jgi:hypothetical protein
MMEVSGRRIQWQFWKGWNNEFDFLRVRLSWRGCCGESSFEVAFLGFELFIWFNFYSTYDVRQWFQRKLAWWRPCPDCGQRFGKHDDKIEHIPF